ncbi:SelB domain-containing protein [Ornithinicoccus halotolerans]|uniref:SelB domain-containing protein n=1 Tax=Ornithinicoccus halotolerans TaxID=1748220 RepID=UPI001297CA7F|nr:SelB C-terminal domain-containing protein [Ornithinicoccus halotolerans]
MVVGEWWVDGGHADRLRARLAELVAGFERARAVEGGLPLAQAATELGLPDPALVHALLPEGVRIRDGRLTTGSGDGLPPHLERALGDLVAEYGDNRFVAPPADRLRELGLADRDLAAAARAGRLLRLAPGVVLPAGADEEALRVLAGLPAMFTASQARQALGTSRRVVLPLLDHLDRTGRTRRLPDDRRQLR